MIQGVKLVSLNKELSLEWGEGLTIRVRSVSRRDTLALASEGSDRTARKQKKSGFQADKFMSKLFDFALIGWDGLTYATLAQIVEGWDFSGQKQDEVLEHNAQNKAFVLENMNPEFSAFLNAAIEQAGELGQANLGN